MSYLAQINQRFLFIACLLILVFLQTYLSSKSKHLKVNIKSLVYPVDTASKWNVHTIFRRRPRHLLNGLRTCNLLPWSRGCWIYSKLTTAILAYKEDLMVINICHWYMHIYRFSDKKYSLFLSLRFLISKSRSRKLMIIKLFLMRRLEYNLLI